MAQSFKKRAVSPDSVAAVEMAAAAAQIVRDPRFTEANGSVEKRVGSSQDPGDASFQTGQVHEVPVGRVRSNPFNPRAIYTATAVDDMAQSLAAHGQRIAATGFVDEQGSVVLIEGETRLRGARAAGLATLRVEIRPRPANDRELYEEARASNVERREQSPLDDALKWRELLAKNVYPTQAALARALELGEDHVSRTLSLAALPSRLIHAMAEHPDLLTHKMLNALREFYEVQGDEVTMDLVAEVAKTGLGYRDVVARRKAAAKGPVKRTRATCEGVTYQGAKGEIKSFEENGRVEFTIKGLSAEDARVLTSKLATLFTKA